VLAALARQETAIKRVVILAEEQALAPGASSRDTRDDDSGYLDLGRCSVKIVA